MRQLSKFFLLILICFISMHLPAYSAYRGGINYSLPLDYSKLSETELAEKAREYYFNALQISDNSISENTTKALFIYSILSNLNPENIEYPVKIGILNDKLGRDRYAKGHFSKAIGIDPKSPIPYYYYGEFYYKRTLYRKALKYYIESYKLGYKKNYDLLYKMGDIYEKFGDTKSALKYLKEAELLSPNPELKNKIKKIETNDLINKEYYSNTRIKIN